MRTTIAALALAGLLAGCSGSTSTPTATPTSQDPLASVPAATSAEPAVETSTATPTPTVGLSDYRATLKVLNKQCFGSAGCNVDVRVSLAAETAVQDIDVEVTVEISGDESGPTVQTVQVEGGQYTPIEVSLSTPSSKTKIKAKVTEVTTL